MLEGGTVDANYPASTIKTASALFDARFNEEDNKLIDISYNKGVAGDIDSVVEGLVTNGTDVKNMNVLEPVVTVKSALNDASLEQLDALADAVAASLAE